MQAIFISYRREDSEGHAGRLSEDLAEHFGKGLVFMDVTGIEPGRDFRRVIEQQVASCGVLLAIIGKEWLTATDAKGQRRLDDPSDFVRLETASALKRDIPVVPVLVHGATMPRAEQLPDDLKDLAFRNSVELTHARWASDVALLISALKRHVNGAEVAGGTGIETATDPGGRRVALPVTAGVVLAALAAAGYFLFQRFERAEPVPEASVATSPAASAVVPAASVASSGAAVATVLLAPPPRAASAAVMADTASAAAARPAPTPAPPALAQRSERPVSARPAAAVARATPERQAAVAESKPSAPPPPVATPGDAEPTAAATSPARVAAAPAPAVAADVPAVAPALPSARGPKLELMGSPGVASMATRTIVIGPDTKYVNVTGGEIIRFTVGDKQFVWNFNGPLSSFDLARVAPTVLDRKVTAYVAPNPFYPRRN